MESGHVADPAEPPKTDNLSGTVTMRNANWKADYLANQVEIAQATLQVENGQLRWDPVVFSYGPVKGTASLDLPAVCNASQPCPPGAPTRFTVQFGDLDASALQAAILGAHQPGTLLSSLIERLKPSDSSAAWPPLEGTVNADSLILGPVTLTDATASLRILPSGPKTTEAEITDLDANLLGGQVHGRGTLLTATGAGKPSYTLEGQFEKLNPARVGQLLGLKWSGGAIQANGKIDLSGFTASDLAASVKGALHFDWRHGAVAAVAAAEKADSSSVLIPVSLTRFDRWTADAEIANGIITLKENAVQHGFRKDAVEGTLTLGDAPKVSFATLKENQAKR
jgi:hypothetical protein